MQFRDDVAVGTIDRRALPATRVGGHVQPPVAVRQRRKAEVDVRVVSRARLDEDRAAKQASSQVGVAQDGQQALGSCGVVL